MIKFVAVYNKGLGGWSHVSAIRADDEKSVMAAVAEEFRVPVAGCEPFGVEDLQSFCSLIATSSVCPISGRGWLALLEDGKDPVGNANYVAVAVGDGIVGPVREAVAAAFDEVSSDPGHEGAGVGAGPLFDRLLTDCEYAVVLEIDRADPDPVVRLLSTAHSDTDVVYACPVRLFDADVAARAVVSDVLDGVEQFNATHPAPFSEF